MAYDDAVIICASMNGELVKIDRAIIQLKMEHLLDYLSMQFTFVLLHLCIYFIYVSASSNNMELYFLILDVALSLPEMIS
jgi:hypothetical protein